MVEPIAASGTPTKYRRSSAVSVRSDKRLWKITRGAHTEHRRLRSADLSPSGSDRLLNLAASLVSLASLTKNWDTYGADPPSEDALRRALKVLQKGRGSLLPESIVPSVEGGVTFVYSADAKGYAEIEFGNNGEVVAAFKRSGERPKIWLVRDDLGIVAAVAELRFLLGSGSRG